MSIKDDAKHLRSSGCSECRVIVDRLDALDAALEEYVKDKFQLMDEQGKQFWQDIWAILSVSPPK